MTKWKKFAKQKGGATSAWLGYHASIDKDAESSADFYAAS
jgi:hypothetical protein